MNKKKEYEFDSGQMTAKRCLLCARIHGVPFSLVLSPACALSPTYIAACAHERELAGMECPNQHEHEQILNISSGGMRGF